MMLFIKKTTFFLFAIVIIFGCANTATQKPGEKSRRPPTQLPGEWAVVKSNDSQRAVKLIFDISNMEQNTNRPLDGYIPENWDELLVYRLQIAIKDKLEYHGYVIDQEATAVYYVDVEALEWQYGGVGSLARMSVEADIRVKIKNSEGHILASKLISAKAFGHPHAASKYAEYGQLITDCVEKLVNHAFEEPILNALFKSKDPAGFAQYIEESPSTAKVAFDEKDKPDVSPSPLSANLDLDFGSYYALVIGNNDYQFMPKLKTAVNDAKVVAEVLKNKYGFNVEKLYNATRLDTLKTLNRFRRNLTVRDNLLIYYAGHGWLDEAGDEGYWLPVDAEKDIEANWISNSHMTTTMRAMAAKHVIVVADSCYSGKLTRGVNIKDRTSGYLERLVRKKSRTVLSSGGLEPVIDSGGKDNHSVFASAFIGVLTENQATMEATQVFSKIRRTVILNSYQTPEYGDIRHAGHDGGDFLFVPLGSTD